MLIRTLISLLLISIVPAGVSAGDRPNILVLFADDLRADFLGAYGSKEAQTPNLDKLAQSGITFTEFHIMGGDQGAVCVPSRAMLMSGRELFRVNTQLKGVPTWPQQLRAAGYSTHMTGKWHNGAASCVASFPSARSVFLGGMSDQFRVKVSDAGPDGMMVNQRTGDQHSSELFAGEAIRFLKEQKSGPWALYVAFTAPHDPREAPAEFKKRFDAAKISPGADFLPEHPFDNGELVIRDEKLEKHPRTPEAIQRHRADYHAIISHMDDQIGRILQTLEESGQAQNTVVVFLGDNGLAIGGHGLMGKQSVYEHSVRVPCIVRGPGIAAGRKSPALALSIDICPTLCGLAGTPPPEKCDGRSLLPILTGGADRHRDSLWFAYRNLMRAWRDDRWKVIHSTKADRWQLFDLQSDPLELKDLSAMPEHAARFAEMKEKVKALPGKTGAGD